MNVFLELFSKTFWKKVYEDTKEDIFRLIRIFLIVTIVFLFIEPRFVPTPSMSPTIEPKTMVLVEKWSEEINRGDIVAFKDKNGVLYIKRVIGLPGEEVVVEDGKVFINGNPLEEPYLKEPPEYETFPYRVPKDSYYLLGDNRNDSYDSSIYGAVKRERIFGKVWLIIMPPWKFKVFSKICY